MRDEFECQQCGDGESTLCVHHLRYVQGWEPWDYPDDLLMTLCEECHNIEYECMKDSVDSLIEQIKDRGFLAGSVSILAKAFNGLIMPYPPEVMSDLISFSFMDEGTIREMDRRFFEFLKKNNLPEPEKKAE
jgi:hypothetical protein